MGGNANTTQKELDAIIEVLKGFNEGASIEQIRSTVGLELRTLQRRLARLLERRQVTISGNTRARRYHWLPRSEGALDAINAIPLSPDGQKILSLVSAPIQHRRPVGYERKFLEGYRPNKDSYLAPEQLKELAGIGKTSMNDQPAGTYANEIMNRLLIDLSWNSSRLEGNTYSLLDTERLLSLGETSDGKSAAEAQMILNHKDAIEFLVRDATDIGFNRYTLLNLHALLSNNLLPNPAASGRLRTIGVGIGQSVYTPLAIQQLIEEMFGLMLTKASAIKNPFEQAFFIMVQLPYLQPFDNVNKRVSRLAANISLNRHNLAPLSFVDVPNDLYVQGIKGIYEMQRIDLLRDVFMWAYERSAARYAVVRQSLGEPDPFRMKYRHEIRATITAIVAKATPRAKVAAGVRAAANPLPAADRARFIETVETELMNLHAGNFARYWISPAQFEQWKKVWNAPG